MKSKLNRKIGITGSSGLIGRSLKDALEKNGFNVITLNRAFTINDISECDVIVNLAGANISGRWTKNYKKEIFSSRIETTKKLTDYIAKQIENNKSDGINKEFQLINASATGIYLSDTDRIHTESNNEYGNDFLAEVCKAWEQAATQISSVAKVAILRFGVVITPAGGALPKMVMPAKFGLKLILGSGNQKISWISLEDLLRGIIFIIENREEGIFNFTAPGSLTYRAVTDIISHRYRCFLKIRVPDSILKLLIGEGSKVLTSGNITYPERLIQSGFSFNKPLFDI